MTGRTLKISSKMRRLFGKDGQIMLRFWKETSSFL